MADATIYEVRVNLERALAPRQIPVLMPAAVVEAQAANTARLDFSKRLTLPAALIIGLI